MILIVTRGFSFVLVGFFATIQKIEVFHGMGGKDHHDKGQEWGNLKNKVYLLSVFTGVGGKRYKMNLLRFPSLSCSFIVNLHRR